jgi:hypothetical protein
MAELAQILGEPAAVHFEKLEPGSTTLVSRIQREAIPKVRAHAHAVRRREGPREALRSYRIINKYLREDNGVGVLQEARRAAILTFPGREEEEDKFVAIRQRGSLDGIVTRVGGIDQTIPILLESYGKQISGVWATRSVAKELAKKLFETVRVFGHGRWSRDPEGVWNLREFKVETFDALDDAPLSSAIDALRKVAPEWGGNSYSELGMIRHGPPKKANGGH